jgi:ABC-2 type transport system permease protein
LSSQRFDRSVPTDERAKPARPGGGTGTGAFWGVALAVAWRVLHNVFTTPSLLFPSLVFPLFFFTAFAGGLSRVDNIPGFDFPNGYTAFQFVFVLLQSAAFGGVFTGFGVARDFEYGFARRLLLAAPRRSGLIAGYVLAALARWLVTAMLLTVVALVAGMEVGGNGVDLFALYALALIVSIAGTLWATGVAMRFRTIQAGPIMQLPVFLALFFAPVYVPLDLLSGWLHAVASVNPATALLEAGRSLISGSPEHVALAYLLAFLIAGALCLWALRGLRSAERAG